MVHHHFGLAVGDFDGFVCLQADFCGGPEVNVIVGSEHFPLRYCGFVLRLIG